MKGNGAPTSNPWILETQAPQQFPSNLPRFCIAFVKSNHLCKTIWVYQIGKFRQKMFCWIFSNHLWNLYYSEACVKGPSFIKRSSALSNHPGFQVFFNDKSSVSSGYLSNMNNDLSELVLDTIATPKWPAELLLGFSFNRTHRERVNPMVSH